MRRSLLLLALMMACSSCDKRGPVRTQLQVAEAELKTKKAQHATLQEESKAASSTPMATGQSQIDRLTKEVEDLKASIEEVKQRKAAEEAKNAAIKAEKDAYLAKHTKL
ncbi:hypothetical protein [Brevifollis gellanilyticus]|nr:hypothetical protein [Brevifollis gellanilyticus]